MDGKNSHGRMATNVKFLFSFSNQWDRLYHEIPVPTRTTSVVRREFARTPVAFRKPNAVNVFLSFPLYQGRVGPGWGFATTGVIAAREETMRGNSVRARFSERGVLW
jgi:hypothetical protein